MNVVTATKSNNTITVFVNDNGVVKPIPATSEHPKWAELVKAWNEQNHEEMLELMSMKRIVEKFSSGDLVVSDTGVFYREVPLVGIDVDRIMAFLRQGEPYQPIANYMVRKLKNPSKRAITEMYNFLEHKNMPLTPNGTILAYKGVQKDFFSVSTGKEPLVSGRRNEAGQIFNGVGEVIEMNRSDVDDDFRRGCSGGLHAGSLSYAKDWARSNNGIIILIEIDPADVVSVPEECACAKLRCCKYRVIGTYDGPLPDTYTADYSDPGQEEAGAGKCENCGNPIDDCDCGTETCDECGEEGDMCVCNRETPEENPLDTSIQPMQGTVTQAVPMVVTLPIQKETTRELLGLTSPETEFRQKLVAMISEQCGCDPNDVTDDKTLGELGFDSLDGVEFVMALEEKFQREITDEEAGRFENGGTVGEIITELWDALQTQKRQQSVTELVQNEQSEVAAERNVEDGNTYEKGYQIGLRNGVRRRKRAYLQGDENNVPSQLYQYVLGYNDGYRAGRKDYKH